MAINCEVCGAPHSLQDIDFVHFDLEPFALCEKCSSAIIYVDNEPRIALEAI